MVFLGLGFFELCGELGIVFRVVCFLEECLRRGVRKREWRCKRRFCVGFWNVMINSGEGVGFEFSFLIVLGFFLKV